MDPSRQCYIESCINVADRICEYSNCWCRGKKKGGCTRKFCDEHRFSLDSDEVNVCINCFADFRLDARRDKGFVCCETLFTCTIFLAICAGALAALIYFVF